VRGPIFSDEAGRWQPRHRCAILPCVGSDDGKDIAVFMDQWWRTVYGAAQIWMAAPQVILMRSARVGMDGFAPRADTRRELARMVHEKTTAAGESATAVALQMWRTNWELALMPMRLWWGMWAGAARWSPLGPVPLASRQLVAAASKIVPSGLAPVRRRVTANAKRLRRRRPG
jgi:hypothetical protein